MWLQMPIHDGQLRWIFLMLFKIYVIVISSFNKLFIFKNHGLSNHDSQMWPNYVWVDMRKSYHFNF